MAMSNGNAAMAKAAMGLQKRGVLMTASSRKRGSWKEQQEDVEVADSDNEPVDNRKASQKEWEALEKEVQSDMRKKVFDAGLRPTAVTSYDDVASDEDDEDDLPSSAPSSPEAMDEAAAIAAARGDGERVVPQGVVTAGEVTADVKKKTRGGKVLTGAERRKRKAPEGEPGEDGKPVKKKKKEDDPDRWLKLRLEGEEKQKRIDATRLVYYHAFDDPTVAAEAPVVAPSGGSSRSMLRNLFDGSDDDDDDA